MKVKELIKELKQFHREMEVCFECSERGDISIGSVIAKSHDCPPAVTYCLIKEVEK
jgi:hypothetical protein